MIDALRMTSIDPSVDPEWDQLVQRNGGSVFHSRAWINVLKDTYDLNVRANMLCDDAGDPIAGLHYCEIDDIRGRRTISLPFSDYCDPLVNDLEQWRQLSEPLFDAGVPIALRCLHNDIPLDDDRLTIAKRARWHGRDLSSSVDEIWASYDGSARRAVRKAEREGVTVRVATSEEDLRTFFLLHLGVRKRKYRLLAQPYPFFQHIWRRFNAEGKIALMLASINERDIAGVLYLIHGETLYYKFNASDPDSLAYRPTDLLIWEGMKLAKSLGLRRWDFGLSDWDQDSLIRYKAKFGTDEKTISFLRYEPARCVTPAETEIGRLLPFLTELLTETSVPDEITERGGNLLYRHFM